jgi:Phosphoenolpyruvate carboxylase
MIQAKFGLTDIAVRTMEVYTTATLEATLGPAPQPAPEWRDVMDQLSARARSSYRAVVYDDPRFLEYFRFATPEPELRRVRIGSRPVRRDGGMGVEGLRAIPWQFAWTQTRLLLPSWLGVEDALDEAIARGETSLLHAMYERWPFFQSTLDLIEMVLAKADSRIAAEYDRRLVPVDLQPLGRELRSRLKRATTTVLAITGHRKSVETTPVLRRSIDIRNPYVDPINLVQIELLARLRQLRDEQELMRAFVVTVNGIAAGMRNTDDARLSPYWSQNDYIATCRHAAARETVSPWSDRRSWMRAVRIDGAAVLDDRQRFVGIDQPARMGHRACLPGVDVDRTDHPVAVGVIDLSSTEPASQVFMNLDATPARAPVRIPKRDCETFIVAASSRRVKCLRERGISIDQPQAGVSHIETRVDTRIALTHV